MSPMMKRLRFAHLFGYRAPQARSAEARRAPKRKAPPPPAQEREDEDEQQSQPAPAPAPRGPVAGRFNHLSPAAMAAQAAGEQGRAELAEQAEAKALAASIVAAGRYARGDSKASLDLREPGPKLSETDTQKAKRLAASIIKSAKKGIRL